MAMTREEEKELRLNSSLGSLLGSLSSRDDLKKPNVEEETGDSQGGAERQNSTGNSAIKPKDEEEGRALEFFTEEGPDYEEDDPHWVVAEKKYLIEEYGKKIITLSFDEKDRFLYTCELCNAHFIQRKILASHCYGMKHLRKKNLLDRRLQGKEVPELFKVSKSDNPKVTKPSQPTHPSKRKGEESDEPNKKKWFGKKDYDYGNGQSGFYPPNFMGHPPGFQGGPPPGFQGGPGGPPPGFHGGPPPGFPGGPPPGFFGGPPPPGGPGGPPPGFFNWGPSPPNTFNTPPPAVEEDKNAKGSLAGGHTGSLLEKLANCSVVNEKDSELAVNVVIALMKSLKDFNHKRGETRYIEILTEADITFRQMKTIKPTNQSNGTESDTSASQSGTPVSQSGTSANQSGTSANPSYQDIPNSSGASNVAQSTPTSTSQDSNYSGNNQYYGPQMNSSENNAYSYGNGANYPSAVPPPYGQYQGYPGQMPPSGYENNDYSNQGYYDQGQGQNSSGYPYTGNYPPMGGQMQSTQPSTGETQTPSAQTPVSGQSQNTGGQAQSTPNKDKQTKKKEALLSQPPPPPPPQAPTSTPSSNNDSSVPDLSNYGYAAGYSMGYYNVPPPAYSQPY